MSRTLPSLHSPVRSRRLLAAGVAALVLVIGACGDEHDDSVAAEPADTDPPPSSPSSSTEAPAPTPTEPQTSSTVAATTVAPAVTEPPAEPPSPTIVLVHGAFADGSSWGPVSALLQQNDYDVIVPELELRSVADDAVALRGVLDELDGPVVVVGHSYGGIVMSNAALDAPSVEALVFVAGFAPDEGESISSLQEQYPGSMAGPETLAFTPYTRDDGTESVDVSIQPDKFAEVFAADLPAEIAAEAAAHQRPLDASALSEGSGPPAWRTLPSWFLIATADNVIPADASRAMAARAGSTVVEIDASHAVLVSRPDAVVELVNDAAAALAAG